MKFKIEISTDNAAFEDNVAAETGRILRKIANDIVFFEVDEVYPLRDSNGNTVGHLTVEE